MQEKWPEDVVCEQIHKYLRRNPEIKFSTIVTFDEYGVSSHPNHISVYRGCLKVLSAKQF